MGKLLVNLNNVHKDEQKQLKDHLENNCWDVEALTVDEVQGIVSLISYVIGERVNDKASNLSYTELLNLKNKIQK